MKLNIKFLSILMAIILILPSLLCSCHNSDDEEDAMMLFNEYDTVEHNLISSGTGASSLYISKDGEADYEFVYPEIISEAVLSAIYSAKYSIKDKTGANFKVDSDTVKDKQDIPTDTKEILIGHTNRTESEIAMSELKERSFLIKVIENRVVIVADDDALLIDAINCFINKYIVYSDNNISVPKDMSFISDSTEYQPVKDNGDGTVTLKLNRFSIAYDSDNNQKFIEPLANAFAKRVINKYKCPLGASEDEIKNKYEILLGVCDREEFITTDKEFSFRDFYIGYSNGRISISAFSIYGYENAINYLFDGFGKQGITISKEGEFKRYSYENTQFGKALNNFENPTKQEAWIVNASHRGDFVTNNYPENSIAAYTSCINNKIDIIETDLRLTKDGVWIICHDTTINRTTNGKGKVSNLTYNDIQKYNLKTSQGGSEATVTDYKIPSCTEIINLCKNNCIIELDKVEPNEFQSVYNTFEKENTAKAALFKTNEWSSEDVTDWFCYLIEEGRELPLFMPRLYKKDISKAESFIGLTAIIETDHSQAKETLRLILNQYKMRAMCLTTNNEKYENVKYYTKLKSLGYTAIMTNKTILLKEFIHGK